MKYRSILLIFCLNLAPTLLNSAAESPEEMQEKWEKKYSMEQINQKIKRRVSLPLNYKKGSPREEDKQAVNVMRRVSKEKKEEAKGKKEHSFPDEDAQVDPVWEKFSEKIRGEKKVGIPIDPKLAARFDKLIREKLEEGFKSDQPWSAPIRRRESSEEGDETSRSVVANREPHRNQSSNIASKRFLPHSDLSKDLCSESPRAKQRRQSEPVIESPRSVWK